MRMFMRIGVVAAGLVLAGSPAAASANMASFGNIGIDSGISAVSFQGLGCHAHGHEAWYGGDFFDSFEFGNIGIVDGIHYGHASCGHGHGHGHGHYGHCWKNDRDEAARLNSATDRKVGAEKPSASAEIRPAARCSGR